MNALAVAQQLLDIPTSSGGLTRLEFEAWKLNRVNGLSLRVIAAAQDKSLSTIRDQVRSADRKIERHIRRAA